MRKEHDSLGIQSVPQTAYYGIHTVRARGNFPAVSSVNDRELIKNFLRVKLACARANQKAGRWDDERVPLAIIKPARICWHTLRNMKMNLPSLRSKAVLARVPT